VNLHSRAVLPLALASLAASLVVGQAPADADGLGFTDPVGDDSGGLDITSVSLDNRAHAIVTEVQVDRSRAGHLIVSIDRRHGVGRSILVLRNRDGDVRASLRRGSFFDAASFAKVRCAGLDVSWDQGTDTVAMTMPARCMDHGDYGRVRFSVLTEKPDSGDSDYAPDGDGNALPVSDWIARD
jgi:hypothetical protein